MSLTVRAYNVLFGDAILVSWKEDDGDHHAWIDFGNFHNDPNAVFEKIYRAVLKITKRLDLVVITHRHLDHMEGFHALRKRFAQDFHIERLWHAHVTPQTDRFFQLASRSLRASPTAASLQGSDEIGRVWRNNLGDAALTSADRMAAIRKEMGVPAAKTFAIHRETDLAATGAMPPGVRKLRIEILAPERDSRVYLQPLAKELRARGVAIARAGRADGGGRRALDPFPRRGGVPFGRSPLRGLADLARLRRQLRTGDLALLAAVDQTRNNTSIVMRWTHGNTSLLFAADAEETSWKIMRKNRAPLEATLVKVGHHGSINASPEWSYDKVMPRRLAANAAIVSTDRTRFTGENEVPKREVLAGWGGRLTKKARLLRTDKRALGTPVTVEL